MNSIDLYNATVRVKYGGGNRDHNGNTARGPHNSRHPGKMLYVCLVGDIATLYANDC